MTEEPDYTRRFRTRLKMMLGYVIGISAGLGIAFLGAQARIDAFLWLAAALFTASTLLAIVSLLNLYRLPVLTPPGTRPLKAPEIAQRRVSFSFLYLTALFVPIAGIFVAYSDISHVDVGWALISLWLAAMATLILGVWAGGALGGRWKLIGEEQPVDSHESLR